MARGATIARMNTTAIRPALLALVLLAACEAPEAPGYPEALTMPAPTDDPSFATDATYTADADAWAGDANRVDPGPAIMAEGFQPGVLPAEHLNHVLGVHGDWINYLEDERDTLHDYVRPDLAASRGTYLSQLQGVSGWDGTTSQPGWSQTVTAAGSQGTGLAAFHWAVMAGGNLPQDCTIESVRVFLKPGAARATSTDRMRVRVYRLPATGLVPVSIGDERDNGTTALQSVLVSGLSIQLNNDESSVYGLANLGLLIQVDPGQTIATDAIYLAEIRYTTAIR